MNETDQNLVRPEDGCPLCSERHVDKLVWVDNESVECQMCGTAYQPGGHTDDVDE
ncbi:MAG: hypothetical protein WBE26_18295 [Phycisphaerae bacterium]